MVQWKQEKKRLSKNVIFVLQEMEEQLIPHIRYTRQTPMYAIRVTWRVWQLLWLQRLPELTEDRRVTIFSILWELSDVDDWNLWTQFVEDILHHAHRRQVRTTSPVALWADRSFLAIAIAITSWLPFSTPEIVTNSYGFMVLFRFQKNTRYSKWQNPELLSKLAGSEFAFFEMSCTIILSTLRTEEAFFTLYFL